jgi:error-prone DNA polymerase
MDMWHASASGLNITSAEVLVYPRGRVERQEYGAAPIVHLLADRIIGRSDLLGRLSERAGDPWEAAMARADEAKHPNLHDSRVQQAARQHATYVPNSRDFR